MTVYEEKNFPSNVGERLADFLLL